MEHIAVGFIIGAATAVLLHRALNRLHRAPELSSGQEETCSGCSGCSGHSSQHCPSAETTNEGSIKAWRSL